MNAKTGGIVMLVIGVILSVFSLTTTSFGEIVAVGEMFGDRSAIVGYMQKDLGDEFSFIITLGNRYKSYKCSGKWDQQKMNDAANKISEYINKNKNIDLIEMLKKAGLQNCL